MSLWPKILIAVGAMIGVAVVVPVLLVAARAWQAFVAVKVWTWLVASITPAPDLPFPVAFAAMLLLSLPQTKDRDVKDEYAKSAWLPAISAITTPAFILLTAWLGKEWLL